MPIIYTDSHRPPFWLPNGHFQTVMPSLFRKVVINYKHERIETDDDDFLDLFWSNVNEKNRRLVILTHGLEGDASRQYITGMVRLFNEAGYNCLAWNYRSCGNTMNRQLRTYHSGETTDLQRVISYAENLEFDQIYLIGFSLGGNVTLKYLGEQGKNVSENIKKSVVFSVPMDLEACSRNIELPRNWVYAKRFLRTLKPKIEAKAKLFPDKIDVEKLQKTNSIFDFDNFFTGPIHGFNDAIDYYTKSSSKHFFANITIPTLIVNAKNDPLVPYEKLPLEVASTLKNVTLEITEKGGHCGFRPQKLPLNLSHWSEQRALEFIDSN